MNEIITSNLRLKRYTAKDAANYRMLRLCPEVWRYSTKEVSPDESVVTHEFRAILQSYEGVISGPCALFLRDGEYIGEAGIYSRNDHSKRVNIGYNLLPDFWNKGYASEITAALVRELFSTDDIYRIEATVVSENLASRRVLEKAGMQFEGELRAFTRIQGKISNICYYSILRPEYHPDILPA